MKLIIRCWQFLARTMGEGDYERYCEHLRRRHSGQPLPSPKDFYLRRLQERYSRPTRCC